MFPLYDENPRTTKPYVNYGLIIANFIVFIWELIATRSIFLNNQAAIEFMLTYGFVPARFLDSIANGSIDGILPIFSGMFMHAGIFHIGGNMLFLWIFGDNIEDRFGHAKYLVIYLFWGVVAALAHTAWIVATDGNLLIPAVGASGAVSGVLGAYMLMFPRAKIVTIIFFFFISTARIPAFAYLLMWFIYQVILAPFGGGVAYLAHIGGFVAGAAAGFIYKSLVKSKHYRVERGAYIPLERPLRLEGIVTRDYVEVLADLPRIAPNTVKASVKNNILHLEALSDDKSRKYEGNILLRVDVEEEPESIAYLNGILRLRFRRI
jgi:membrane associated rhomboid family serine protease